MLLKKPHIITAVKILVGTSLLVWLLSRMEWNHAWQLVQQADALGLTVGLISFAVAFPGFFCYRFHVLAQPLTGSFRTSSAITLIGFFFNNFLPTNVGGDGMRFLYLKRRKGENRWEYAANILLVERLFGFLAVLMVWLIYAAFTYKQVIGRLAESRLLNWNAAKGWMMLAAILLGLTVAFVLFLMRKRLFVWWHRAKQSLHHLRKAYFAIPLARRRSAFLLSLLFHAARGLGFYFFASALGAAFFLPDIIWLLFLTTFIGFLPISVGALGTLEGAVVLGLVIFGVDETLGMSVALMYRMVLILISVTGGLMFLRMPR